MDSSSLQHALCRSFCNGITVTAVPSGYAISTVFQDSSGDRLTFYVNETPDGYVIEDDGDYLATLVARDIPITEGTRGQLLDSILSDNDLFWDRDTYEIRSRHFEGGIGEHALAFISAIVRVRDLELLTRETIRSTFKEDFVRELDTRAGHLVKIEEDTVIDRNFSEFPADLIVRPTEGGLRPAAVYLVNSNDKLNEALLAWQDRTLNNRHDFTIVGVIEDPEMKGISRRRFQRAQNRQLPMPIFRGDEDSAIGLVLREVGLKDQGLRPTP
jgi:hypothetical protein